MSAGYPSASFPNHNAWDANQPSQPSQQDLQNRNFNNQRPVYPQSFDNQSNPQTQQQPQQQYYYPQTNSQNFAGGVPPSGYSNNNFPPQQNYDPNANNMNSLGNNNSFSNLAMGVVSQGFLDPNANMASMGLQIGNNLLKNDKVSTVISWMKGFKYYFAVSNSYVLSKIKLLLCPFLQSKWQRELGPDGLFLPPREDINAPDLYLPTMAFITYILLLGFVRASLFNDFHPEILGVNASASFIMLILEVLMLKGAFWAIISEGMPSPSFVDLSAYCGYKYVGFILELLIGLIFGWSVGYISIIFFGFMMATFMARTLVCYISASPYRNQFLAVFGVLQILISFFLVRKAFV